MIPRIGKGGASFGDTAMYYVHDPEMGEDGKRTGKMLYSSDRFEWAAARNLSIDVEVGSKAEQIDAVKKCGTIMQWTADHQADIKLAAGGSMAGRPMTKPVYTYSLSWAPHEEVSKAEMIKAADETLKRLGLRDHQVLIVAHNDTHMSHVHCIVNRVNPKHGRTASKSCDRLNLSKWAEAYEKRRGSILVPQRVLNNAQRTANKNTYNRLRAYGDGQKIVKSPNLSREEAARLKAYGKLADEEIRARRAAQQVPERSDMARRMRSRHGRLTADIEATYGERRRELKTELVATEARIGATGWFRQAIRRVTGHQQRDLLAAQDLKQSIANLEQRASERAGQIRTQSLYEIRRFKTRHANERGRDEEFIAGRKQAEREAAEARALKAKSPTRKRRRGRSEDVQETEQTRPKRTRDRSAQRREKREAESPRDRQVERDAAKDAERQAKIAQYRAMRARSRKHDPGMGED